VRTLAPLVGIVLGPALVAAAGAPAHAQQPDAPGGATAPKTAPRQIVNLRVGAASDVLGTRDDICLEVAPVRLVSIEACGNGSGFLNDGAGGEIAHFRLNLRLAGLATRLGFLEPRLSLGFAEMQLGDDAPGFHFGGTDAAGQETSGAEAGLSVRSILPIDDRFEAVISLGAYLAWMPYAPDLADPRGAWQPSFTLSAGVGF